jgi:hypothetical protein
MVSQPEPAAPSSLSHRGPSSVVSRPSLSRTRRYNRSHAGVGSANGGGASGYAPQNEFPVFSLSGDVEIIVRVGAGAGQNRYLLHRDTLSHCSGFFEASTSDQWSRARTTTGSSKPTKPKQLAGGNELARIGEDDVPSASGSAVDGDGDTVTRYGAGSGGPPRKRWRYELDPGSGDGDIPMLVQRDEAQSEPLPLPPSSTRPSIFGDPVRPSAHPLSRTKAGHHSTLSVSGSSNRDYFHSVTDLNADHRNGYHRHHGSGNGGSSGRHHRSSSGSSSGSNPPPLSKSDQDLLRDYDNLFRTMYNYPPVLDGVNVADAYVQCKSLLALADLYDALPVVGPRVDHHLLQFQSRLWKQIAKYPISYLRLGYLARSKIIFQEALVHVVGQWPAGERSLRANLPGSVLDLIEDKVDELEEVVSRIEGKLFRLTLVTSRGERVSPGNAYLDWLAVSLFRQWIADNTSPAPVLPLPAPSDRRSRDSSRSRIALPMPPPVVPPLTSLGRAYRTLGSANPSSFLGHDECKRFLKLTPDMYSRDNLRRFEKRMDELKAMARDIVRPLMDSGLELDMGASGRIGENIGYLTCTAVGSRDLPWAIEN